MPHMRPRVRAQQSGPQYAEYVLWDTRESAQARSNRVEKGLPPTWTRVPLGARVCRELRDLATKERVSFGPEEVDVDNIAILEDVAELSFPPIVIAHGCVVKQPHMARNGRPMAQARTRGWVRAANAPTGLLETAGGGVSKSAPLGGGAPTPGGEEGGRGSSWRSTAETAPRAPRLERRAAKR